MWHGKQPSEKGPGERRGGVRLPLAKDKLNDSEGLVSVRFDLWNRDVLPGKKLPEEGRDDYRITLTPIECAHTIVFSLVPTDSCGSDGLVFRNLRLHGSADPPA